MMLPLLILLLSPPDAAEIEVGHDETPAVAGGSAEALPSEELRLFAAIAGRKVAGRPVGGPFPTADKILLLSHDTRGNAVIGASLAIPVRQSLPAPPEGTLAVVRLHQRPSTVVPGPTEDDFAFVAANRMPLFVIGEWDRPAPMWEVVWLDGAVRFRTIGEVGEIGPWQQ